MAPLTSQARRAARFPAFSSDVHPIFCELPFAARSRRFISKACSPRWMRNCKASSGLQAAARHRSMRPPIESSKDPEDAHAYHRLYWALRYAEAAAFGHAGRVRRAAARAAAVSRWPMGIFCDCGMALHHGRAHRLADIHAFLDRLRSHSRAACLLSRRSRRKFGRTAFAFPQISNSGLACTIICSTTPAGCSLPARRSTPNANKSAQWREQALELWDEYFPQLVLEDGTFAEQSSHYHLSVVPHGS